MASRKKKAKQLVVVSFYVPDSEVRNQIQRAAEAEGMLPTVWMREIIMQRVRVFEKKERP